MRVTLRIKRFNPEKDEKPWWGDYEAEAEPDERLLDALYYVKSYVDGTLTFRHSCVHGVCGSDAMRINGSNTLACQVLVKNLGSPITIEPLPGLRVIKDLLVDMERFFELYQSVHPYFISYSPPPDKERLQSTARSGTVRRHDQVHPLRLLYECLPVLLGQPGFRRPGGDCQCPPLRFRQPRRGVLRAAGDPRQPRRRLAVPHDLQLRRGLPAGDQDHAGHQRGKERPDGPAGLEGVGAQ